MKSLKYALVILSFLGVYLLYYTFAKYYPRHESSYRLQIAIEHFSNLQEVDTLDFSKLMPFEWDTVYIFEGYTSEIELSRELSNIDWSPVMGKEEQVPSNVMRFIFLKDRIAVNYWDVSYSLIRDVQFKKYCIEGKYYKVSCVDSIGQYHRYANNLFSRQEAKFILVRNGLDNEHAFCDMKYFMENKRNFPIPLSPPFYMHSLSGCGFSDCLANKDN